MEANLVGERYMKYGHKIGFARSEKQREREGRGGEFSGGRTGGGDRVGAWCQ